MIAMDVKTLKDRLEELADALGARAPGDTGIKVWFNTLKIHRIEDVVDAMDSWARGKTKFPAPSEIHAICSMRVSDRVEHQAESDKADFKRGAAYIACNPEIARHHLGRALASTRAVTMIPSATDEGASIRSTDPKAWAHKIINGLRAGHGAYQIQINNACIALDIPVDMARADPYAIAERMAIESEARG